MPKRNTAPVKGAACGHLLAGERETIARRGGLLGFFFLPAPVPRDADRDEYQRQRQVMQAEQLVTQRREAMERRLRDWVALASPTWDRVGIEQAVTSTRARKTRIVEPSRK